MQERKHLSLPFHPTHTLSNPRPATPAPPAQPTVSMISRRRSRSSFQLRRSSCHLPRNPARTPGASSRSPDHSERLAAQRAQQGAAGGGSQGALLLVPAPDGGPAHGEEVLSQ